MVELLLAHGADATRIGVGRRILHPELAPLSRAAVRNLIAPGQRR
jgi:hypothetical protein